MDSMTELEAAVRLQWIRDQWNKPDRHDHYIMQLCQMWAKKGANLDKFRIPFKFTYKDGKRKVSEDERRREIEQRSAIAKAALLMRLQNPGPRSPKADPKTIKPRNPKRVFKKPRRDQL